MVHYAVESVLAQRGFLSMVRDGAPTAFTTQGGEGEEAVERLVEAFQAELWGGRVPARDLIATYEHACHARDHAVVTVTGGEIDAIRERLDRLTDRWSALGVDDSLMLEL